MKPRCEDNSAFSDSPDPFLAQYACSKSSLGGQSARDGLLRFHIWFARGPARLLQPRRPLRQIPRAQAPSLSHPTWAQGSRCGRYPGSGHSVAARMTLQVLWRWGARHLWTPQRRSPQSATRAAQVAARLRSPFVAGGAPFWAGAEAAVTNAARATPLRALRSVGAADSCNLAKQGLGPPAVTYNRLLYALWSTCMMLLLVFPCNATSLALKLLGPTTYYAWSVCVVLEHGLATQFWPLRQGVFQLGAHDIQSGIDYRDQVAPAMARVGPTRYPQHSKLPSSPHLGIAQTFWVFAHPVN